MSTWKIAAGTTDRPYSEIFHEFDVMLIGPGDPGQYHPTTYSQEQFQKMYGPRRHAIISQIRDFKEKVKDGDLVLMRLGYELLDIGIVHGSYEFHQEFDDVLGWDLQHTRRVRWANLSKQQLEKIKAIVPALRKLLKPSPVANPTLGQVRGLSMQQETQLKRMVPQRSLKPLPNEARVSQPLSDEKVGELMFRAGLPGENVDRFLAFLRHARRLWWWYLSVTGTFRSPSEAEIVTHLVIPLMRILGWSEQQLAVEWSIPNRRKKIDLVLFDVRHDRFKPLILCEVKRLGVPLEIFAAGQAQSYADSVINADERFDSLKIVVVTDGMRYFLYRRRNQVWDQKPSGYANLSRLRTRNLIPQGTNAIETLVSLMPRVVE